MTATEEIQAAIDKLTTLKAESSRGPWAARRYEYGVADEPERVRITSPADDDAYNTAEGVLPEDAKLIVTLHATIEAQLAFLHEALYQVETGHGFLQKELNLFLRLARAINGGA